MARKVFISFLGTNNYQKTRYQFGDCISEPVRFVQEALIGLQCRNWSESDSVIIFCTEGSREKNWVNNGQERAATEDEKEGLESRLSKLGLKAAVSEQDIREGFTENDMWEIFNTVYNYLEDEDEIYLDVTHAFRSIPLFTIPLFNFAKFMKGTKLAAIFYGAFEARNKETNITPIVELSSLVKLQATNVAASNFAEFGKVGSINFTIDNPNDRSAIKAVKEIKRQLELLDYLILTCNMEKLRDGEYFQEISELIDEVCALPNVREAEKQLLRKILDNLSNSGFTTKPSEHNIVSAARWAINHNMVQQAYTLGEEFMLYTIRDYLYKEFNTYVSPENKGNEKVLDGFVRSVLAVIGTTRPFQIKTNSEKLSKDEIAQLTDYYTRDLRNDDDIKEIKEYYNAIRVTRNNLNHANEAGGSAATANEAMDKLRNNFNQNFNEFLKIFPAQ